MNVWMKIFVFKKLRLIVEISYWCECIFVGIDVYTCCKIEWKSFNERRILGIKI